MEYISHKKGGKEDELVDELFVEEKDPVNLFLSGEASERELDLIAEAYMPWIDEEMETERP